MPFDPAIHYALYKSWSAGWNQDAAPLDELPQLGWVFNGCVMGFMARADGRMGVVCHLISDPAAPKLKVTESCFLLQDQVLATAEYLGIKKLIAATAHKGVAKGMLAAGWASFPGRLYLEKEIN